MSEYLPKEIRDQLAAAQTTRKRKRATRSVHIADEAFAILDMSDDGFSVEAATTPGLRGLIDIYEGPRHLYQALIIASEQDGDAMRYEFKRNTAASTRPALDFEVEADRPIGLLSKV